MKKSILLLILSLLTSVLLSCGAQPAEESEPLPETEAVSAEPAEPETEESVPEEEPVTEEAEEPAEPEEPAGPTLLFEDNFDGTELDSGTVVEFCFAKMLDMPAVLLRTDFRRGGDNGCDPWNLMCSCYPRTSVLFLNAMERYHQCKQPDRMAFLNGFYSSIAKDIIRELDKLVTQKSWLGSERVYDQLAAALQSIGGSLHKRLDAPRLKALADAKKNSGLY